MQLQAHVVQILVTMEADVLRPIMETSLVIVSALSTEIAVKVRLLGKQ